MKRRTFLQKIGSILAVLGITEAQWLSCGNRYYQALAQPGVRKLALLVGINHYPQHPVLGGCLTDVELQKELLIYRFGFPASDILTVTEEQATRELIESSVENHLGKQVKPGDTVVFHFSGYGTRINLGVSSPTLQNALIPVNGKKSADDQIVNYLLEETLLLLLRSLSTDKITAILDTSYHTPSEFPPTALQIRAVPESPHVRLATEELEFLQQLKTQKLTLNNSVVLSATSNPKELARELLITGGSVGLFTYALTQYLWEITPPQTSRFIFSHLSSTMYRLGSKQQPALLLEPKNLQNTLITDDFFLQGHGVEGVVTAIENDGNTVQLWLGGLPLQVLEDYGVNSRWRLDTGEELIWRSRTGFTAKAQLANPNGTLPQVGQFVQESLRVIPKNIDFTVALDTELQRIERVDATSAFATLARLSTVVAGNKPADYLFGKLREPKNRYGLFSLSGDLILNTAGEVGEAVKGAVQRLAPKFSALFATKLWRLTENEGSSRLSVKASLEIINKIAPVLVMEKETGRTSLPKTGKHQYQGKLSTTIPSVPVGSRLQYRVQNLSTKPIYLLLVGLNNSRTAIAFYPWQFPKTSNHTASKLQLQEIFILPGETIIFPQSIAASGWLISAPSTECEHQLILSTSPFAKTLVALETAKYPTADQQPIATLVNPTEVALALLEDLHNASVKTNGNITDAYALDVNNWASFSFSFRIS